MRPALVFLTNTSAEILRVENINNGWRWMYEARQIDHFLNFFGRNLGGPCLGRIRCGSALPDYLWRCERFCFVGASTRVASSPRRLRKPTWFSHSCTRKHVHP